MRAINRRNFFEKGGKATLAAGALMLTAGIGQNRDSLENVFVHHVFFWLKEPGNALQASRFEKALKELVTIGAIKSYQLGKPAETRREVIDSSYQYSLLTIFNDKAAQDEYQVHPVHDMFRKVADELCSKVIVYDSVNF
ncbi:MAG TPA: Dabb family protein [Bacteroidales bacterium]|nr:Dabb family protein [Bacteroidales bacterium]